MSSSLSREDQEQALANIGQIELINNPSKEEIQIVIERLEGT